MKAAQAGSYLARARRNSRGWIDVVRLNRPNLPWHIVIGMIRSTGADVPNQETLVRHVRRLVAAGDLPEAVLDRARASRNEPARDIARRIAADRPGSSLRAIGRELDALGVRPARAASWSPQTVKALLEQG